MIEKKDVTFRHQMPAQLRFSDVDQLGHVNNSVYFSLFDMCKAHYLQESVGGHMFDGCSVVVAHVEADFIAPIHYPDEIAIRTATVRLGNKSLTIYQEAFNARTGEVKCLCETVMVMIDMTDGTSRRIPDDFRRKIENFEH